MQVKTAIVALGAVMTGAVVLAGPVAAQPYPYYYGPYQPYWAPGYPAPVYRPPAYGPAVDFRELVTAIQDELDDHGYEPGPVDGLLDAQTIAAIRQYQADANLSVTGEATQALLDHLRYHSPPVHARVQPPTYQPPTYQPPAYPAPSYTPPSSYTPPPSYYPTPPAYTPPVTAAPSEPTYTTRPEPLYSPRPAPLLRGDPDIAWVQTALQRKGYTPGVADGIMGERTRRAIEAFQRDNGLAVDGVVSPTLLNRLR